MTIHGATAPPGTDLKAATLGRMSAIASRSRAYRRAPLAVIALWLEPAAELNQAIVLFDRRGSAIAYATYAYLSEEVANRLVMDDRVLLDITEWREGSQLWVIDLVSLASPIRDTLRALAANFPGDLGEVRYLRRREDGKVRKVVSMPLGRFRSTRPR